jgi:hypothetical protein
LTAEGTTSKGTGSISCEVEFCIFYRISLGTLRTKDVVGFIIKKFVTMHGHMNVKEWNIILLDDIVTKFPPILNPEGDYRVDDAPPLASNTESVSVSPYHETDYL